MNRARADQLELPLRHRHTQAVGRGHLALDGRLVTYRVKRSLRRTAISIVVDEEGVRVGAPWTASESAIERLLRKHAGWVLRKIAEWQVKRAPPRQWVEGEPVMLFGSRLALRPDPRAACTHVDGTDLVVRSDTAAEPLSSAVVEWLREQARASFAERVEHYRRALDIANPPQVRLSSARSRWGSCHASGRIHLNWRLVQMPQRLIDYVVAHEVAHLLEMNHSERFWRTVGRLVTDYELRRAEIRREGHRYLLV